MQLLVSHKDIENYKKIRKHLEKLKKLVEEAELWVIKQPRAEEAAAGMAASPGPAVRVCLHARTARCPPWHPPVATSPAGYLAWPTTRSCACVCVHVSVWGSCTCTGIHNIIILSYLIRTHCDHSNRARIYLFCSAILSPAPHQSQATSCRHTRGCI